MYYDFSSKKLLQDKPLEYKDKIPTRLLRWSAILLIWSSLMHQSFDLQPIVLPHSSQSKTLFSLFNSRGFLLKYLIKQMMVDFEEPLQLWMSEDWEKVSWNIHAFYTRLRATSSIHYFVEGSHLSFP